MPRTHIDVRLPLRLGCVSPKRAPACLVISAGEGGGTNYVCIKASLMIPSPLGSQYIFRVLSAVFTSTKINNLRVCIFQLTQSTKYNKTIFAQLISKLFKENITKYFFYSNAISINVPLNKILNLKLKYLTFLIFFVFSRRLFLLSD